MTIEHDDLKTSKRLAEAQRPRDAATLVVIRRDGPDPRVLLGQRHAGHAFMPGKFVFPGGRLDPEDCRQRPGRDLPAAALAKLQMRMRGRPSIGRARGLALAAVRETFEETGFIVGTPHDGVATPRGASWARFLATGHAPDLSGLSFFARAITPPGRTRRFDTRFFAVDGKAIANPTNPVAPEPGELLEPRWFGFAEALELDLPSITKDVLKRLLAQIDVLGNVGAVPFQYMRGKTWRIDSL